MPGPDPHRILLAAGACAVSAFPAQPGRDPVMTAMTPRPEPCVISADGAADWRLTLSTLNDNVDWTLDLGGGVRVALIQAGTFKMDVGVALGPVPRRLWQRVVHEEVDGDNRMPQALNCLLVETAAGRVLVETGIGERLDNDTYLKRGVEGDPILPTLRKAGFEPETVDFVVLSHLHFDHAGGLLRADGRRAFQNAAVIAQLAEWEIALQDNPRIMASYDQPELLLVRELGILTAPDGETELMPSVTVFRTGGHTAGHQGVVVRGATKTLAFFGDLAMRPWSFNPRWTTSYDDFPLDSVVKKQQLFHRAVEEEWIIVLSHERKRPVGRISARGSSYQFTPL
jgi:glyoxylase-like metal-dependent hydrolase (beta-lactamase superfamily II)